MTTVTEAFKQYKTENPEVKIGKSKFASLCPPHVLPVSDKDHNVCCCQYHENFDMLLDGIQKIKQNIPSTDALLVRCVCSWNVSCHLGECEKCRDVSPLVDSLFQDEEDQDTTPCPYLQWTNEYKKVPMDYNISNVKKELTKQLFYMRRHTYIAKIQLHQIKRLKNSLKERGVLQEDFSENFNIKQQDEVMSAHWVTNGVTLFTAVLNTITDTRLVVDKKVSDIRSVLDNQTVINPANICLPTCPENVPYLSHLQNTKVEELTEILDVVTIKTAPTDQISVVVSDELHHDKFAVAAYNRAILEAAKNDGLNIDKLHLFTNGAGSQFKNRFNLSNILKPEIIHNNLQSVDWSFFATAHDKGPVDGVGGTVKRSVWRRILQKKVFLRSPKEFADVAREVCPNVNILYVDSGEVDKVKDELKKMWDGNQPRNIPDTRATHYFKRLSATELEISTVSPFLPDIHVESTKIIIFKTFSVNPKQSAILCATTNINPEQSLITSTSTSINPEQSAISSTATSIVKDIKVEQYYAVDFVDRFYVGRVLETAQSDQFWKMKFLHQFVKNGVQKFAWPKTDDFDDVRESVIFYGPVKLEGFNTDFVVSGLNNY